MNEPTSPTPTAALTDSSEKSEWPLPLSRRQRVLLAALVIVVAIIVWRRQRIPDGEEAEESKAHEAQTPAQDDAIEIPVDPEDELEKDAVVIEALKGRDKFGGD